jgi:hypothetical protein
MTEYVERQALTTGRNPFVGFVGEHPEAMIRSIFLIAHPYRLYRDMSRTTCDAVMSSMFS